jgi:hypothetical protein
MTTKSSIPMVLFAIADAITRGGMPEPTRVEMSQRHGLSLEFDSREDLEKWARRIKVDDYRRTSSPWTDSDGVLHTLITAWGQWHATNVDLRAAVKKTADIPTPELVR